jgi:hypothetical protein
MIVAEFWFDVAPWLVIVGIPVLVIGMLVWALGRAAALGDEMLERCDRHPARRCHAPVEPLDLSRQRRRQVARRQAGRRPTGSGR